VTFFLPRAWLVWLFLTVFSPSVSCTTWLLHFTTQTHLHFVCVVAFSIDWLRFQVCACVRYLYIALFLSFLVESSELAFLSNSSHHSVLQTKKGCKHRSHVSTRFIHSLVIGSVVAQPLWCQLITLGQQICVCAHAVPFLRKKHFFGRYRHDDSTFTHVCTDKSK
jgi:hypothetical protein